VKKIRGRWPDRRPPYPLAGQIEKKNSGGASHQDQPNQQNSDQPLGFYSHGGVIEPVADGARQENSIVTTRQKNKLSV
jgi:hypothetical protein